MKVIWHKRADRQLDHVAEYIRSQFGTNRRRRFLQEVHRTEVILRHNPNIGRIDPLFADRPIDYRSIVISGLSKMVYYVKGDTIRIAAFWDTRSEPETQAEQVR